MTLLETAIHLATRAHAGQTDADGMPHIVHSFEIMLGVKKLFPLELKKYTEEELLIAAILHDTVEDSFDNPTALERVDLDRVEATFGTNVREIVDSLTRRKYLNGKLRYDVPSKTPGVKMEFYRDLIYRARDNEGGAIIKPVDLAHNFNRASLIKSASWREKLQYKYPIALRVLNSKRSWEDASWTVENDDGDIHFYVADPNGKRIEVSEEQFKKLTDA